MTHFLFQENSLHILYYVYAYPPLSLSFHIKSYQDLTVYARLYVSKSRNSGRRDHQPFNENSIQGQFFFKNDIDIKEVYTM